MPLLPPVAQTFVIDAAKFLAGIDQMIAGAERLAESLNAVTGSTERVSAAANSVAATESRVSETIAANTAAFERQGIAVDALIQESRALTIAVDEAAVAIDRENVALDTTIASSGKAAGSTAALGSHMKTAFLGIGLALVYSIAKAASFQSEVTRLYTAAGLTGVTVQKVSKDLLNLGDKVGFTGTQMAQAMYHPISAGLSYAAALKVVAYSAELAQIHGANLEDTTYALSSVMKAYGVQAKDVGKTSALLNSIVGQGDMRFQDFVQSIKNWTPTGAAMGISIQSMGAAIAYLTDRGNSAEVASTRLTMGLSLVTSGSKQANTYLSALGLTTGTLAIRNQTLQAVMLKAGLTTNKIAADLKKPDGIYVALEHIQDAFRKAGLSASQSDEVMAKIFGGGRSDKAMLSLMSNLDNLRAKYHSIGGAVSGFGGSWAKTQQTVAFEFHKVVASVENLAISFGSVLLPATEKVLAAIAKFLGWMQKNPVIAAFAGAILATAVAFKVATGAAAMFSAALDANPVMLIIIGVIALAAGLYELYKHFAIVRQIVADVARFFKSAWTDAMHAAGSVIKWFTDGPLAWIKAQIAQFQKFWEKNHVEIMRIVHVVWTMISAYIKVAWDTISGIVRAGLIVLKAVWTTVWDAIKIIVKTAWNLIATIVSSSIHEVLDIISIILDVLQGHWSQAWNHLKDLVSTVWHALVSETKTILGGFVGILFDLGKNLIMGLINGVKSMFGTAVHAMGDLASGVVNVAKSIFHVFSPSRVFYEMGANITLGLGLGIAETKGQATREARKLAEAVLDAYQAGQIKASQFHELEARIREDLRRRAESLRQFMKGLALDFNKILMNSLQGGTPSQVKAAMNKLLTYVKEAWKHGDITYGDAKSLTNWLERDNARLETLATRRANILKTMKAAEKYAATTTSNVESWASLSNAAASMPQGGGLSGAGLLASLQQDLATIRRFNQAIQKLAKLGLNKKLLDQIIQAGPVDGLSLAEAILSGPVSQITQLNKTEQQIVAQSTTLGHVAANAMYDTGKDAGKGFLDGLRAQQEALKDMMTKLADEMIKRLKKDLGIEGGESKAHRHGKRFAKDLADGIDAGKHLVDAATHRLTGAVSFQGRGNVPAGGSSETHYHIDLRIHLDHGFIGSDAQFTNALTPVIQKAILQLEKRNPTPQTTLAGQAA